MDRNLSLASKPISFRVAPLAGSVDRNLLCGLGAIWMMLSLPSRGAWIEIAWRARVDQAWGVAPLAGSVDRNYETMGHPSRGASVAPLAGSVDRNWCVEVAAEKNAESLPSRGAWIEILQTWNC